ncbi:hypothetical protein EE612_035492 [Oryza sativa]|nr:hypothetical protein EE612_035492 [Oryza sativa]
MATWALHRLLDGTMRLRLRHPKWHRRLPLCHRHPSHRRI